MKIIVKSIPRSSTPPLRIVVLVSKFDISGQKPYLTDELCAALQEQGHTVDVIFLDWYREHGGESIFSKDGLTVHLVTPAGGREGILPKIIQWVFSSFRVARYYKKHFCRDAHDLLISFSPSIIFAATLLWLRARIKNRLLIQWDFFPFHQAQIGLLPFRWMISFSAAVETTLLNTFSYIGCMSPRNVAYLRNNYKLSPAVKSGVLPIWAKVRPKPAVMRSEIRMRYGVPEDAVIAVFGGQVAAGRGVEDLVEIAKFSRENYSPLRIVVIGTGPRMQWLLEESAKLGGYLIVLPPVPRNEYLELIASCDIGLVLTVPNVDIPSFPSKVLDYCCVGIPVAAAVESSTDFGEFIVAEGLGQFCEAGKPVVLFEILSRLSADPELMIEMGGNSRRCYENYFDVRTVAVSITSIASNA